MRLRRTWAHSTFEGRAADLARRGKGWEILVRRTEAGRGLGRTLRDASKPWSALDGPCQSHEALPALDTFGDARCGDVLISDQAGLFSASLTAFLIESYRTLSPDQGQVTIAILAHISQQLAAGSNSSAFELPSPRESSPTATSLACNILWFISLCLSLSCALIATLVEQWARDFMQATEMRPSPITRARIFSYLYYGVQKFSMHSVVELIPLLLHTSLVLFFAGLVAFLHPVNGSVTALAAALLALISVIYLTLTVLPIIYSDCPYRTPL
ncbi:hypothetical protein FB451DRAFT_1130356, partial [Mycena latifolia]